MNILGFVGNVAVRWFAPLLMAAILLPFLQVIVFVNLWLGMFLCLVVGAFLCRRVYQQAQIAGIQWYNSWQFWVYAVSFGFAALLAPTSYFGLWALLLETVVLLAILGVPGVILPSARAGFVSLLSAELILTLILMSAKMGGATAGLVVLALLAVAAASLLFGQAVRPYELRRAKRRAANWLYAGAVVAILAAFPLMRQVGQLFGRQVPIVAQTAQRVVVDSPIGHIYRGIMAKTQIWAEPKVRVAVDEATSTEALKNLQRELSGTHHLRWADRISAAEREPVTTPVVPRR